MKYKQKGKCEHFLCNLYLTSLYILLILFSNSVTEEHSQPCTTHNSYNDNFIIEGQSPQQKCTINYNGESFSGYRNEVLDASEADDQELNTSSDNDNGPSSEGANESSEDDDSDDTSDGSERDHEVSSGSDNKSFDGSEAE